MTEFPSEPSIEPSNEPSPPARRRILLRLFLGFCVFSVIGFSLLGWYVTTDSFQQMVRRRVVASFEKITGGRVELGELHTTPFRLRVDARNLTIHGRETPDQAPFLRVDRLQAELKIISLLSTTVGLHSLVLEHPVVHIIVHPDGTTNAPVPQASISSGQGPVEQLLALSVSHIAVQRGELLWNDMKVPFDFAAKDLALLMNYSLLRREYEAHVVFGSVATRVQDRPPVVWQADALLVLANGRADISNLIVTSGKSEIHFAGRLQDFQNPQVSGEYHGVADLGELAPLARQPQVRRGTLQFEGKGSWSRQDFSTQGTVQSKDIEYSSGKLSMRNGRFVAGFSVTPDRLRVTSIKANLFGGDLLGDADVTNWQSSLEPLPAPGRRHVIGRVVAGSLQRGSVHLQLAGFPVSPALSLLSSKKLPLDRLNLSASASGRIEMLWVGSIRDSETHVSLALSPPLNQAPGGIPLRGQMDATYRGSRDELEVSQLRLATATSEITAVGNLAGDSALRFSLASHNVKEWAPLLEAAYGSSNLPVTVHGWGSLAGTASGSLAALSVSGNLEVYDFDTTLPATGQLASRVVHWDALSTAIQYSRNHFAAHDGSLIHGHTMAHFDASATLADNALPENAPFTLHFDVRDADMAEIAQLAGVTQPFAGTLNMSATVSGTRANPHGDGHFELRQGIAYGVSVPVLRSDLRLAGGELQFNNIETSVYDAPLSGSAAVSTSNREWSKNEFRLNLAGHDLNLARLPRLQTDRFTADGVADFTVRASGTAEQPSLEARVHLKDLALDKERVGDFYVDAVTRARQLQVKAHSDFSNADLTIAGTVGLERDFLADLDLAFHHLDVNSLLRIYLPGKITGHAPLDGTLKIRGPLRTPRDLKAAAEIQAFSAEIEHVPIQSAEPIRFEVADQVLLLENFHLGGSGTDFTAHGRAHLSGAQEIDLRLEGSVNMTLLQSLSPKILARGNLGVKSLRQRRTFKADIAGTFGTEEHIRQSQRLSEWPQRFEWRPAVQSQTHSDRESQRYQRRRHGEVDRLRDLSRRHAPARSGATAHDVRLRYPPGVSSTANADLRLTGTTNSAVLSGDVLVTKLAVTPGFDFGAYIEKSQQSVALTQNDSLANRLKLDVHVVTTPELQMQTAIARLSGNADLRLRGTAERPAILGRVEVLEGKSLSTETNTSSSAAMSPLPTRPRRSR